MTCRICLVKVEPSKSINIFTKGRSEELISDLIMNFAYVEVFEDDDLPKTICQVCLKHLRDIYDFKDLIIRSDERLRAKQDVSSGSEYSEESLDDNSKYQPIVQISEGAPVTFDSDNDKNNESVGLEDGLLSKDEPKRRREYKCDQCAHSYKNRYSLILHKTTHTGKFPHNCDICKKGFPTNWAMNVHRRIHFEDRPFKCENCDKSFKSKSAQIIHRKIHLGIKRYHCKICAKGFIQIGGLRAHEYTHTDEKPLICEFCGKYYTSKRALDRHFRNHKGDPSQPCPICGKLYAGEENVKIHLKTVHAQERVRFPCEVCDKKFSTKAVLKIHMRIHDGVKPYSCDICGKSFRQASVATLHKRVHTGETPFPCALCEKKFAYKHHLKKHVEREHPRKELT
ncbi:zinc finger protein 239 [Tribolium castaneum]|uniref:Zinc finger protein 227-like Protein n=1 Tax=Tribolium castaneum TaxID=7070 RepID=D6WGG2_TRICA|nr:PREDICTED: zinc finger protein 239 [Tribolium castaneum]EFA00551.1 Zinc finger protein 227-like Protein [Tribolium castaneum]|eukprot:XP_008190863.1 PREDICTED: zinc finger protein 239 [Tribolium castaneum]